MFEVEQVMLTSLETPIIISIWTLTNSTEPYCLVNVTCSCFDATQRFDTAYRDDLAKNTLSCTISEVQTASGHDLTKTPFVFTINKV